MPANYAINPTPEQALRSSRAMLPARVIAALGPEGVAMPHRQGEPKAIALVAIGFGLGVFSWLAAGIWSGTFEPYDSSAGLLVNQAVLTIPTVYLAWRYRPIASIVMLIGSYLGMNSYSYVFGGSEARAWVLLGTIMSVVLVAGPAFFAFATGMLRFFSRRTYE